jgi:hypothetical protein
MVGVVPGEEEDTWELEGGKMENYPDLAWHWDRFLLQLNLQG